MTHCPCPDDLHDARMETGSRKRRLDLADERPGQTEPNEPKGQVHEIGPAKRLDQPVALAATRRQLVMQLDHASELVGHDVLPAALEIRAQPAHRGREVVDGAIGPDPEIVERGRDGDTVVALGGVGGERTAEVEDAVDVAAVGDPVVPELGAERVEDLFDTRVPLFDASVPLFYTSVPLDRRSPARCHGRRR